MLPMANNGSVIIYHRVIKPFVKKHEKDFDVAFSQVGDIAKDVTKHGKFVDVLFVVHYVLSKSIVQRVSFSV